MKKIKQLYFSLILALLALPTLASAHEVYVLDPERVQTLEKLPSVPFFTILQHNMADTILWGILVATLIVVVFFLSIFAPFEMFFDKYLFKLKHFAPFISRVTAGLAFILCGYHQALFGPELSLHELFGSYAHVVSYALYITGALMVCGLYTRFAGFVGLALFFVAIMKHGLYMVTYMNYFMELILLILIGGHRLAIKKHHLTWNKAGQLFESIGNQHGEFGFFLLRVGFGISLIYASVYAKILHNQLALAVVNDYDLISVFGFNPEFIVFGAAIIEVLLGIFFVLGLEIRFTAIVLNIFLTLSLLYFGEAVWPHVILIGIPIAFFCYGYDKYSLEGYFFKKGNREPIF